MNNPGLSRSLRYQEDSDFNLNISPSSRNEEISYIFPRFKEEKIQDTDVSIRIKPKLQSLSKVADKKFVSARDIRFAPRPGAASSKVRMSQHSIISSPKKDALVDAVNAIDVVDQISLIAREARI
jgi:hypothetical protein